MTVGRSTFESCSAAILIAEISNALNEDTIPTTTEGKWPPWNARNMGDNPAHVGRAAFKDTISGRCRLHRQTVPDHRTARIVRVARSVSRPAD